MPLPVQGGVGGAGAAGGGSIVIDTPIFAGYGPYGPFATAPSVFVGGGMGGFGYPFCCPPTIPPPFSAPMFNGGPFRPNPYMTPFSNMPNEQFRGPPMRAQEDPPGRSAPPNPQPPPSSPGPKTDPTKSDEFVRRGDRFFRIKDYPRARIRYARAQAANPNSADPLVHEAQVDLTQGHYQDAAERIREAITLDPEWIFNAPDIQAIYAEPSDFAKQIAKLETHLQTSPNDRDGWLVLGFENYLSGKIRQAADIFTRLTDRRSDSTLYTLLQAATPKDEESIKP